VQVFDFILGTMTNAIPLSNEELLSEHVAGFHTEWSDPIGGLVPPDPWKHETFVAYAKLIAADHSPYLLSFLAGCKARVLVGLRIFCFDLPFRGKWIDVPQIAERLQLLPWAEPDEAVN